MARAFNQQARANSPLLEGAGTMRIRFALPSQLRISAAAVVANQPAVKELQ